MTTRIKDEPKNRKRGQPTILRAAADLVRCGAVTARVSRDRLPDNPRKDFLTTHIERSLDAGQTWEVLASATTSGKRGPEPSAFTLQYTNADGVPIPIVGTVRVVVDGADDYEAEITLEYAEAVDPPPLRARHHSVAHDGEANVTAAFNFANSFALNGKTSAGDNRCAVVHIGWDTTDGDLSAITYGGNAMTLIGEATESTAPIKAATLYRYVAPPTAGTNVAASFTDDIRGAAGCSSYNGVDQTTPIRAGSLTTDSGTADPATITVSSATGDMVVDAVIENSATTLTIGAGQTSVVLLENTAGGEWWGGGSYEAGAASVTMSWTVADTWAQVGASLQAAGGGASIGGALNVHVRKAL